MLHMRVCCGSYDGLQGAGNRHYCTVATQGVSKRNPCWPGWRPAGGRVQCVYACHRTLESSGDRGLRADRGTDWRTEGQRLPISVYRCQSSCYKVIEPYLHQLPIEGAPQAGCGSCAPTSQVFSRILLRRACLRVGLSVCLSACISSKMTRPDSTKFSGLPVAVEAQSFSDDNAVSCVLAVSWMT